MRVGLVLLIAAVLTLIGGPQARAGGTAILSGTAGTNGVIGPSRNGGELNYVTLGAGPSSVAQISTASGAVRRSLELGGNWTLPAATLPGDAGGLSADGETLVLTKQFAVPDREASDFLILNARALRTRDRITLPGPWGFHALSPDGLLMYLVQYRDPYDPLDYRIRQYDLAGGVLRRGAPLVAERPRDRPTGLPVARTASADGANVYTLYVGGREAFVYALRTGIGQAQYLEVEEIRPNQGNLYVFDLEIDPDTGVLTVIKWERPVAEFEPVALGAHRSLPPLAEAVARGLTPGGRLTL